MNMIQENLYRFLTNQTIDVNDKITIIKSSQIRKWCKRKNKKTTKEEGVKTVPEEELTTE